MKKIVFMLLVGTMLFSTVGCSKQEPVKTQVNINVADEKAKDEEADEESEATQTEKNVSAKDVADNLLKNVSFKDELSEMDIDTATMFYDFSSVEIDEAYIYESSGATAEEIVVIKCKDSDNAAKLKDIFAKRIDEQIESYTDYVPEEVPKLKDAVTVVNGDVAVLCVCDESAKAKGIIEELMGK